MLKNSNSVSIHVRRGRFFEPKEFSNRGSMPVKEINLKDVFEGYFNITNVEGVDFSPKYQQMHYGYICLIWMLK